MSYTSIRYERDGDVAVVTFNNPAKLNPMTHGLQVELRSVLAGLHEDRSVRALVLTGEGKAFCVGADLSGMGAVLDEGKSLGQRTAEGMEALANRLILDLRESPVPVVSAVNGPTAGAGVGIALAADVVLAARSAYFYLPFMCRLGIVPDLGTTWFLDRMIGRARAAGLTMLGERLPAEKAAQWGLVWDCVDDAVLRQEALALAHRLAKLPAHAALETRRAYDAAAQNTLAQQLSYEAQRQRELIDRPEFAEGVHAFLEKREPRFAPR